MCIILNLCIYGKRTHFHTPHKLTVIFDGEYVMIFFHLILLSLTCTLSCSPTFSKWVVTQVKMTKKKVFLVEYWQLRNNIQSSFSTSLPFVQIPKTCFSILETIAIVNHFGSRKSRKSVIREPRYFIWKIHIFHIKWRNQTDCILPTFLCFVSFFSLSRKRHVFQVFIFEKCFNLPFL